MTGARSAPGLSLYGLAGLAAVKRFEYRRVEAAEEVARHTVAVFVRFRACRRMGCSANHNQREEHPTGPLQ